MSLHSVKEFVKLRDKIYDDLVVYNNQLIKLHDLEELVYSLFEKFKLNLRAISPLREQLRCLTVTYMSNRELKILATKIAGGLSTFNKGENLRTISEGLINPEWMFCRIVKVKFLENRKLLVTFGIIEGSMAGEYFNKEISINFSRILALELGFNKFGKYRLDNPRSLVGMCLNIKFLNGKELNFMTYNVPSNLKTRNKELIHARLDRLPTGQCKPFKKGNACSMCPIGFDKCQLATIPITINLEVLNKEKICST